MKLQTTTNSFKIISRHYYSIIPKPQLRKIEIMVEYTYTFDICLCTYRIDIDVLHVRNIEYI